MTYLLSRRAFLITTAASAAVAACAPAIPAAPTAPTAGGATSSGSPKSGGTLTIGAWNEPRTLGITNRASDVVAAQVSSNICNTLVRYDLETQTFVPELAESWMQTDPVTWVFKLPVPRRSPPRPCRRSLLRRRVRRHPQPLRPDPSPRWMPTRSSHPDNCNWVRTSVRPPISSSTNPARWTVWTLTCAVESPNNWACSCSGPIYRFRVSNDSRDHARG